MTTPKLQLTGFTFSELFTPEGLDRLDHAFLRLLAELSPDIHQQLMAYRHGKVSDPGAISALIIDCAPYVQDFLAKLYAIEQEVADLQRRATQHDPIYQFKSHYIQKHAKRRLAKGEQAESYVALNDWLEQTLPQYHDRELAIATLGIEWLSDQVKYESQIDKLIDWCVAVMCEATPECSWVMFKLPNRLDYDQLVPQDPKLRQRDGFALTDQRADARYVQDEINYCVYCHDKKGDFCSKGFPVKKAEPELGLKQNPLDEVMTGCPLEEKISEMHVLKRDGFSIAALAVVMIDNPMCAVTGHRICNDCMKACIYQKQDPVDIPQIETRVLTDVLELPWGVEIYDLLMRWNPLRQDQYVLKPYNQRKVMVMGMGPAGFTLAHHLLMEGCAVVGTEGLKIEPLPERYLNEPIHRFEDIREPLDERIMAGFGGVAEYGITVRWDKNFLKLIYISLMRRQLFSVYGNVRFGGTITVEDVQSLGFDHLAVAVGAGLPRELHIPGSMAPGMRQANDFLMALQLTGAAKRSSLANLQLRLPAVVIGGGLTGVDAATEASAYYIAQCEKTLARFEQLVAVFGEARVRQNFAAVDLEILEELLAHGRLIQQERVNAKAENREPDLIGLVRAWGGVSIVYRRTMQESPAYKRNHEEVGKALEEGIYYRQQLNPVAARLDQFGHVSALVCEHQETGEQEVIPAKAILVATGAKPNIAYEFEHRGTFHREGMEYAAYDDFDGKLMAVHPDGEHCKTKVFGPFTSYDQDNFRVSFLGDTHPVFHGSVVKAIASAKRIYPKIMGMLHHQHSGPASEGSTERMRGEWEEFKKIIHEKFTATILSVKRHTPSVIEVVVQAPMAAQNFQPGQFYRVQNFETDAVVVGGTKLQSEAMAMLGAGVNKEAGTISLMVLENGASSRLFATMKAGQAIALMGPTGVRAKIPHDKETVMIIGGRMSAAHMHATGPALRAAGNKVLYIAGFRTKEEVYCQDDLENAADAILWVTEAGEPIPARRPQDRSVTGPFREILHQYAKAEFGAPAIALESVDRVMIIGTNRLVKMMQAARHEELRDHFVKKPQFTASIYGPMQCMLKGVCAQCLQWQIDPATGERTKAVYACSWHDQPLDLVDLQNLDERLAQNSTQEILSNLWLDYLFAHYDVARV